MFKKICIYSVMLFTVVISVFPILWIILSAFKTNAQILGSPFSLPTRLDFAPFIKVYTQYNFLTYTFNSLLIAVVAAAGAVIVYSMGAYVFAKYDFRGKNFLYALFVITLLIPTYTMVQPIFYIIRILGMYDTRQGLMLVYLSGGLAFSLFVLRAAFMTVPKELNESATIEGAGFFRIFRTINLPLVKPGLITSGVLMFLNNWNEYFFSMLLITSKTNRTLPLALNFFTESFAYDYTKMFAALTLAVLPGILIYAAGQDQIQASFSTSGIKG